MPLDRVAGKPFGVRGDHLDGSRERSCVRGPPLFACNLGKGLPCWPRRSEPVTALYPRRFLNNARYTMGAYCRLGLIPSHRARVGEIMQVLCSDYRGAVIVGDRQEIACIPHTGCRLEIVATPPSAHRKVNFLLPGQVIRYKRSFFLGDRFELPEGVKVGLRHLVGFKLQLASSLAHPPVEDVVVWKQTRSELERVGVD